MKVVTLNQLRAYIQVDYLKIHAINYPTRSPLTAAWVKKKQQQGSFSLATTLQLLVEFPLHYTSKLSQDTGDTWLSPNTSRASEATVGSPLATLSTCRSKSRDRRWNKCSKLHTQHQNDHTACSVSAPRRKTKPRKKSPQNASRYIFIIQSPPVHTLSHPARTSQHQFHLSTLQQPTLQRNIIEFKVI